MSNPYAPSYNPNKPLGAAQQQPEEDGATPLFDLGDTLAAVPRGVVGAAKGAYNLADTLTGDSLPDWKKNPLGESKSTIGGLVEGISTFASGFLVADPLIGVLGDLAGASKLAGAAKTAYGIGQRVAAGAATDFVVWPGHQERLANLIQSVPALQNPITEYLAADPKDGELEGRLKGVLEGAGLGAMFEGVFLGVKKLKAYSNASVELTQELQKLKRQSTGEVIDLTAEEVDKIHTQAAAAADAAVPEQEIRAAFDSGLDNSALAPIDAPYDPRMNLDSPSVLKTVQENLDQQTRASGVERTQIDPETGMVNERPALRRGVDQLMQRLYEEQSRADTVVARVGGDFTNATDQEVKRAVTRPYGDDITTVNNFIKHIGDYLLNDVRFMTRINDAGGGPSTLGLFESSKALITIGGNAVRRGELDTTVIHEMWHSLARFLPSEDVTRIEQMYLKERTSYSAANPGLEDRLAAKKFPRNEYRYTNIDEWFAETMMEKSIQRLALEEQGQFGSSIGTRALALGKVLINDIITGIKDRFGYTDANTLLKKYWDKRYEPNIRNTSDWVLQHETDASPIGGLSTPTQDLKDFEAAGGGTVDGGQTGTSPTAPGEPSLPERKYAPLEARAGSDPLHPDEAAPRATPESAAASTAKLPSELRAAAPHLGNWVSTNSERLLQHLSDWGVDAHAKLAELQKTLADPAAVSKMAAELKVNPADLAPDDLLAAGLGRPALNLEHYKLSDAAVAAARKNEELFKEVMADWVPETRQIKTLIQQGNEGRKLVADMLGAPQQGASFAALARGLAMDTLEGVRNIHARVTAMRETYAAVTEAMVNHMKFVRDIADGKALGNLDVELLKAYENQSLQADLAASLMGVANNLGRGLGSFRVEVGGRQMAGYVRDIEHNMDQLKGLVQTQGGRDHMLKGIDKVLEAYGDGSLANVGSATRVVKAAMSSPWKRFGDMFLEYWMNSVLSGPKTAVVNGMGPLMFSFYRPIEALMGVGVSKAVYSVAGALGHNEALAKSAMQDKVIREIFGQMTELSTGVSEAFTSVKRLGWNQADVFDGGHGSGVMDQIARRKAITATNAGLQDDSIAGAAVNFIGNVTRIPTNILGSTDNFVKLLNYRAAARGRILADTLASGASHEEAALKVTETMDRLVWNNQVYSSRQLYNRGLEEARAMKVGMPPDMERNYAADYVATQMQKFGGDGALSQFAKEQAWDATATTPAKEGSWSWSLQGLVGRHPAVRLVLPFINTPINIMKATGQRVDALSPFRMLASTKFGPEFTGLNSLRTRFIEDMASNDPRKQAEALGRIVAGTGIAATIYSLAQSGYITGRGPNDPEHRKTLVEAGWQPYAIKTPKGYVSYARMDPLASLVGTAADLVNYSQYAPLEDQDQLHQATVGVAVAIANNLTNKTYVAGLANFLDAAREPDKNMGRVIYNYTGSMVPNVLGQATGMSGDPNVHDVRSMVDAITSKVPGLSATLPPQRNVLGEPVKRTLSAGGQWADWWLPVGYREVSDDSIKQEMASLGHGFTPPKHTLGSMDLNDVKVGSTTAFDRWQQLAGSVAINGMDLKDALRKMIASDKYQRASAMPEGDVTSPRIGYLNQVIYKYRQEAWKQLQNESPQVKAQVQSLTAGHIAAKRGDPLSVIPIQ